MIQAGYDRDSLFDGGMGGADEMEVAWYTHKFDAHSRVYRLKLLSNSVKK